MFFLMLNVKLNASGNFGEKQLLQIKYGTAISNDEDEVKEDVSYFIVLTKASGSRSVQGHSLMPLWWLWFNTL